MAEPRLLKVMTDARRLLIPTFLVIGMAALTLSCGGAGAQQADPYAGDRQAQRLAQYKAQREDYLREVEYLYWAHGCQVLPNEVVITPMLNAIAAGMDQTIIDVHVAGMRSEAAGRGMAKARAPGGCDHWHEHSDEVLAVRQRAMAVAR